MSTTPEKYLKAARAAGSPPGRAPFSVGEPPPVGFTSIAGGLADLNTIAQRWDSGAGGILAGLPPPRVMPHPGEADGPRGEPSDPRVAVLNHPAGLSAAIAAALRDLAGSLAAAPVDVDPGYWLGPAGPAGPAERPPIWSTAWNVAHLAALERFPAPALPHTVAGARRAASPGGPGRVLLIDTGDLRCARQDAFLLDRINTEDAPPRDWHGHGTSMGDLIRLRAPGARVDALRVFEARAQFSASAALLAALNWALHPLAGADVVCVAQRAEVPQQHLEHRDVILSILRRAVEVGFPLPVVVCAVGNTRPGPWRDAVTLPATAPGALAVRAVGWDGRPQDYNCDIPPGVALDLVEAYGGEEGDAIGDTRAPAPCGTVTMVGSSYAAALVAGALIAGR